jgi:hypothetical protein
MIMRGLAYSWISIVLIHCSIDIPLKSNVFMYECLREWVMSMNLSGLKKYSYTSFSSSKDSPKKSSDIYNNAFLPSFSIHWSNCLCNLTCETVSGDILPSRNIIQVLVIKKSWKKSVSLLSFFRNNFWSNTSLISYVNTFFGLLKYFL